MAPGECVKEKAKGRERTRLFILSASQTQSLCRRTTREDTGQGSGCFQEEELEEGVGGGILLGVQLVFHFILPHINSSVNITKHVPIWNLTVLHYWIIGVNTL